MQLIKKISFEASTDFALQSTNKRLKTQTSVGGMFFLNEWRLRKQLQCHLIEIGSFFLAGFFCLSISFPPPPYADANTTQLILKLEHVI